MNNYCVNTKAQRDGNHEVHDTTVGACNDLPDYVNRKGLGWHAGCDSAVAEAMRSYSTADGCAYCCAACHTR